MRNPQQDPSGPGSGGPCGIEPLRWCFEEEPPCHLFRESSGSGTTSMLSQPVPFLSALGKSFFMAAIREMYYYSHRDSPKALPTD